MALESRKSFQCFARVSLAMMIASMAGFSVEAHISPTSPTTLWTGIIYVNNSFPDPASDQQTGGTVGRMDHI